MEIFSTPRLRIRPWEHDDAPRVLDQYSRPEVVEWLGSVPSPLRTLEEAHGVIDRWAERSDPPYGVWAVQVRDSGVVAGTVLLVPLPEPADGSGAGEVEVAWHFHPDSWGHGYATEAAGGALEHGFAAGCREIYAVVRPANARSLAVCRRLGMSPLGRTSRWYGVELECFRSERGSR